MIAYRADVDGLRAVAIICVVLFHTFTGYIPGGFTGVDIFFVISGYLITGIILAESQSSHFSLLEFWMRRCRRILPALFFMLAAVTIVAGWLLLPSDLSDYGGMLASTVVFLANGYLSQDHGYFHPAFLDNPIMHAWSLSVEEQYYLVWPVLFSLLLFKLRRSYAMAIILALLMASLIYSQWAVEFAPKQAFFGLQSRAFELLIGAGLAVADPGPLKSRWLTTLAASGGVILIAAGMVLLSSTTPFPGVSALLPCLGAALLIRSGIGGTQTWGKSLLSSSPFVSIGKISYSWYLWHWPPLAFAHYYFARPLTTAESLTLAGLGLSVAIFSWRFVETPFRRQMPSGIFLSRALPGLAGLAITFIAAGGSFLLWNGMSWRLSAEAQAAQRLFAKPKSAPGCSKTSKRDYVKECKFGSKSTGQPTLLLWGDSHAGHYLPAVARIAEAHDVAGIVRISAGCQPLINPSFYNIKPERREKCRASNLDTLDFLRSHPQIDTVILAGRWSIQYDASAPAVDLIRLKGGLENTINELRAAGKKIIILGQVPQFPNSLHSCVLKQIEFGIKIPNCDVLSRSSLDRFQKATWEWFESIPEKYTDLVVFAPQDHLCDSVACRAMDATGRPLYVDDNHINREGASFLQPFLEQAMRPALDHSASKRQEASTQKSRL